MESMISQVSSQPSPGQGIVSHPSSCRLWASVLSQRLSPAVLSSPHPLQLPLCGKALPIKLLQTLLLAHPDISMAHLLLPELSPLWPGQAPCNFPAWCVAEV
jgi:hypothetical protein